MTGLVKHEISTFCENSGTWHYFYIENVYAATPKIYETVYFKPQ